jgi:CD109 antigen
LKPLIEQKIETKCGETVVVLYFDDIGAKKICPVFKAVRAFNVALQKPAPVVVYDYYDNCK